MTTAADLVSKVPVDILPDDVKQDLDRGGRADQADRLRHRRSSDVLEGQLHDILNTLDTMSSTRSPGVRRGARLPREHRPARRPSSSSSTRRSTRCSSGSRAIDPAAVLQPVSDVLDGLKDAVRSLDLRADVLQPLDDAFGELRGAFAELNPAAAIAPLVDEVGVAAHEIAEALQLDEWQRAPRRRAGVRRPAMLARLDFERARRAARRGLGRAPARAGPKRGPERPRHAARRPCSRTSACRCGPTPLRPCCALARGRRRRRRGPGPPGRSGRGGRVRQGGRRARRRAGAVGVDPAAAPRPARGRPQPIRRTACSAPPARAGARSAPRPPTCSARTSTTARATSPRSTRRSRRCRRPPARDAAS